MFDVPREKLCELIDYYSADLCNDIDSFESLLRAKCNDTHKREVFMLVNALQENIVTELLNPPRNINKATHLSQLTQRLYDNLGFDKALAKWTVRSWEMALNPIPSLSHDTPVESKKAPSDTLELTEEFTKAYELMENTKQCVFLTGKAGTGKSTLLNYFKKNTKKKMVILAPTGIAALNVGGSTLHSFFRLPPRPISPNEVKSLRSKTKRKLYQSFDIIIIDEVSMVRADMMDVIDRFMCLNGKDRTKPFGGVQMIFIGDLFQLPPVVSSDEEEKLFSTTYNSPFFFSAKVFNHLKIEFVELTKVHRQKQHEFIHLLNTIRSNQAAFDDIQQINQRYQPQFESDIKDYYITLTTTNKLASDINAAHLEKLPTELHQFEGEIKGKFDKTTLPTELILSLKEEAQVMFVKNDTDGRWVNGTLGKIKKIKKDQIQVETYDEQSYFVKRVRWEIPMYQFDENTKTVTTDIIGSFTQYPLRLAWAITIHKSQGKQFDKVILDLGKGAFAHGQLYVALSRCKTLDGLILKSQIHLKDVIVDGRVVDFFASLTQPRALEELPF